MPSPSVESLTKRRREFFKALAQARLLMKIGLAAAEDFPQNLPGNAAARLIGIMTEIVDKTRERLGDSVVDENNPIVVTAGHDMDLWKAFITLTGGMALTGNVDFPAQSESLRRAVLGQAYIMCYAQLDAFMADAVTIACLARPELMKSKRQIELDSVLSQGHWDRLLKLIAERHVYDLGMMPVKGRIAELRKRGLPLAIGQAAEDRLVYGEAIRNTLVHAGGVVTSEMIRVVGGATLVVGEQISLVEGDLASLFDAMDVFAASLAGGIARRWLSASEAEVAEVMNIEVVYVTAIETKKAESP